MSQMLIVSAIIAVLCGVITFLKRSNRSLKSENKELERELEQSVELNQKIILTLQSQIEFKRDISQLTASELIGELHDIRALRPD
ncbi:hypothetical protein MMG00_10725 [Ignatzschineria rhizosphaerae]|uniref:Uncharacterized protein n=1 Tax=Ignatzschineria rhizosphaerae TaxID=2923279 RepID=A0ABY3WYJ7_9GAMM|nr:hypothetical protein [Ignatzschineria rhizosphaerae]UNM95683.1 hypothetical protein MMG00_10725 [Ignatzschineria rhizosphaerae]